MIYSYKMTNDNGSAPCPDNGLLTLTICKPMIRKNCKINDYIVGISSKKLNLGNTPKIIFIAKITKIINMKDYYKKYPKRKDCIYNNLNELLINNYHCINSKDKDLSGINSLISNDFIYFGDKYIDLPVKFNDMIKKYQGHKSVSNNKFLGILPKYFNNLKNKYGYGKLGNYNNLKNKCNN